MKLTNDQFDATGCEIGRTWRQAFRYGLIPIGRAGRQGGPGLRHLAALWGLHRFGAPLCRVWMRFEKQAIGGYVRWVRFREWMRRQ